MVICAGQTGGHLGEPASRISGDRVAKGDPRRRAAAFATHGGGHNIDPATIEDALLAHPAVEAAAAVGRPDVYAGEVPVAFVVLAERAGVPVAELAAWAADRVPERAAAPRHVEIVDEIPHTAVGKPFKPELRRRAAEQAAREALAGTAVHDRLKARLVDGRVEIVVPRSADDDAVRAALSAHAWSWRFV